MSKMDKRSIGALWLIIGPVGLLIATIVLYSLLNWLTGSSFDQTLHVLQVILNIVLFILGVLAALAILPGIIVGVILIVTKKDKK
jgi:hypothetical protein